MRRGLLSSLASDASLAVTTLWAVNVNDLVQAEQIVLEVLRRGRRRRSVALLSERLTVRTRQAP